MSQQVKVVISSTSKRCRAWVERAMGRADVERCIALIW